MALLDVEDVAEILEVSNGKVYYWIERRLLLAKKIEGRLRIREENLKQFMNEHSWEYNLSQWKKERILGGGD